MREKLFLKKQSCERGFGLVELLVAMAISAVVGLAAYSIFSTTNWNYMVQEEVVESQQNVRAAMDWLVRDVRLTGFGLPDPPFSLDIDGSSYTSAITVGNSASGPDSITLLGIGSQVGTLQSDPLLGCNTDGATTICLSSVADFFDASNNFRDDRRYISLDGIKFLELQQGQALNGTQLTLGFPGLLDRAYGDGTPVYVIQAIEYSIQPDGNSSFLAMKDHTGLRTGGAVNRRLADHIEDFQVAYTEKGSSTFSSTPADPDEILQVRANIVARTAHEDPKGGPFSKECLEDRATDTGCTGAAEDGYRRRVLSRVVKIRNAEGV